MRDNRQRFLILGLSLIVGVLSACGKSEPPPAQQATAPRTSTPPAAPATTAPAVSAVKVTTIELGNQLGANKRVAEPKTSFAPSDTIYMSVVTEGSAQQATLRARWIYQDGQLVNESTQTIAPTGSAATEFHIAKSSGWPAGTYKVEVSLNGNAAGTKEFEVKG